VAEIALNEIVDALNEGRGWVFLENVARQSGAFFDGESGLWREPLKLDTVEAIALTMANKLEAIRTAIESFSDAGDFFAIEAILDA